MWGKGRILRWEKEIHTVWMCTSIRWDIFILNYTPGKRVLGMTEDRFMEQANPVFKTAIGTVMLLARGGDPLAQDYMKAMGLEGTVDFQPLVTGEEMTESQGVTFKALNYVLSLEYRHKMMNQLILDSGMPSLLDLACGYTTRGVEMGRQGIRYVGGDLPIVASTMGRIAAPYCRGLPGTVQYRAVDVTNPAAMGRAAELLPGKLCIVTEGLLGYLQDDEMKMLCGGIKRVLRLHGGCWITMDPWYSQLAAAVAHALGEPVAKIEAASLKGGAAVSNTPNMPQLDRDPAAVERILESCGLRWSRISFYSDRVQLQNTRFLEMARQTAFREELRQLEAFRITDDASAASGLQYGERTPGNAELYMADGILHIRLRGRLDSLSAPALLQLYERTGPIEGFHEVCLDGEELEYISSSGLRVLLLIVRASRQQKMRLVHVSAGVEKLLSTTAFADMRRYIR